MSESTVPETGSPAHHVVTRGVRWLLVAWIAAAYLAAAVAGHMLTGWTDGVMPLQPAAGLALAALLATGLRSWPGIWLGAFIFSLYQDISSAGLALASIIAVGITLQALLGAWLTRHFFDEQVPLGREGDVWRFLLYAGPLACLVSASIAVAAHYAFGRLAWTDLDNQWLLHWSTHALGVLLFAVPMLLAWPGRPRVWQRSGTRVVLPLLITAALLWSSNLLLAHLEKSRANEVASRAMDEVSEVGFYSLPGYIESLRSMERLFAASDYVTEQEFTIFAARVIRLPGIISVDWAPLILPTQRDAYSASVHPIFQPDASGQPSAVDQREEYFPATYIVPQAGNEAILGLDHGYSAPRRAAMQQARDNAAAVALFRTLLLRTNKPAMITFMPVYRYGVDPVTASLELRRASLLGYVVGVFDIEKLFLRLAHDAERRQLDYRITDVTPGQPSLTLAGSLSQAAVADWNREVEFAGRILRLEMQPVGQYWHAGGSIMAQLSLLFSVAAGFLVAFAVLGATGRNAVIASQVAEKTADLQQELRARHVAEAALRASEQDLDTTLHSIGDAVLATDTQGCITRMNPVAEQLTGWPIAEARGRAVQEVFIIVNELTRQPAVIPVARVLQTGELHGLANHTVLIARDGSECAIADSAAPIRDTSGELRGVVLVFRDVSQERAAEMALQASEERYRQFVELSPYGVFVECDGLFAFLNPNAVALLGAQSQEELLGRPVLDFLHPDSRDRVREHMRRFKERPMPIPAQEEKWLRLDGNVFQGEAMVVPYRYQDRPAALVVVQDITVRKEAEEQLSRFFQISLDMLCVINDVGYFVRVSPSFTQTLGWDVDDLRAHPFTEFLHPDDVFASLAEVDRLSKGGVTYGFLNRYRCKDGSWRWLEWTAQMQPSGLIYASARDVTERRESEQCMRELNEELSLHVAERTQALESLHAKEKEIRAIVENLFDCVITIDGSGIVRSVNPAIEQLLGYTQDELIGHNVSLLMPEPHCSEHDHYLEHYLQTGEARIIGTSREVVGRHKDGEIIPLDLAVNQYQVHGKTFFTGTLRDMRQRNRLLAELTQARTVAEDASRAKSEFLANMSHEIRTPMNAIIGLSHLCLQTALDSKQRDYVGKVHHSARTLLGIINDILDFSKIEAGKLSLEKQDFELQATLASVDSLIGHLARDKGLSYAQNVAPGVPPLLRGDPLRLGQVLLNLAGNAVKFTQNGSVTLSVSLVDDDGRRVKLEFSVRDTGIGLSPRQTERIFQPFSQADASTTREFGGTGLGLAISRRLVEMMEGRLWVESTLGEGSDFRFTACFEHGLECTKKAAASEEELAAAHARLRGTSILLAEDNPFNQQVALELLENIGATVTVVNNGNEALEVLARQPFDLVLMDVQMPEMDGYDATRHIRTTLKLEKLRVVAMTANAMEEDRQRCLAAGMDDFITKPIDPNLLYLRLASWLPDADAHSRKPAASRAAAGSLEVKGDAAVIDLAILGGMVRNDPARIRDFAFKFLKTARETLAEMQAAHAHRDLQVLGGLGHRLKSSARTVGALAFANLCEALELAGKAGDWPAAEEVLPQLPPLLERIAERVEQQTGWYDANKENQEQDST